jgi:hypothetical protein
MDRWLNAQRGWRRLLVAWVFVAPLGVFAGVTWAAHAGHVVGTVPFDLAVAAGVLACLPVTALLLRVGWGKSSKSRPWYPAFSWRWIAYMYCQDSVFIVLMYNTFQPSAWWRHHHHSFKTFAFMFGPATVFFAWNMIYARKLRRRYGRAQQQVS